jgi:hypothetical protein
VWTIKCLNSENIHHLWTAILIYKNKSLLQRIIMNGECYHIKMIKARVLQFYITAACFLEQCVRDCPGRGVAKGQFVCMKYLTDPCMFCTLTDGYFEPFPSSKILVMKCQWVWMIHLWELLLSRWLSMMKFSRTISRVNWLNGKKTNVSKTISVLVLRVLALWGRSICEIWVFHGSEDSSPGLLGGDAVQYCGRIPTFQRYMLPLSSAMI